MKETLGVYSGSLHVSQSSCTGVAQVAFGLPEGINMDLALEHHLFRHQRNITPWPIVHHRIRKHQVHIPLKIHGCPNHAIFDPSFNSLQVHGTLDNLVVIGRFGRFYGVMEDITIAVL